MRTLIPLALAAGLALAGCGDDEPEPPQTSAPVQRPTPRPPPVDTSLGDTAGVAGPTAGTRPGQRPGQPPAARPGAAGQPDAEGQPGRPAAPSPAENASGERPLYTVQVAAFTDPQSAREWTGRLQRQNLPVWTSMAELGGRTFYRVRVGAVPTVSEARRLGALITERFEWPVWVAPVVPSDRLPDDAVADTRRVLGG